ncbi:MAG: protein phosphatase 2C domain-containing protein [Ruminococcus sp.]|nr:protein phosphatase 2C domain-containing protein [Ruminococcus sp.]
MRYYIYGYTDTGSYRDNNEDAVLVNKEIITEGFCESVADAPFITAVCDGVGGENAGELASKLCLQYLSIVDYTSATDMKQVLMNIHGKIKRKGVRVKDAANMQTTLCALAVDEDGKGMCINVGDSRMYRFVNGTIRQISSDQSYGQYMYNKGVIDDIEELDPKYRKAIISSMGSTRSEPDVTQTPLVSEFGAEPDDMIILTTDGVSDYLTENEFEVGLSMDLPISEKLVALAKLAIMNGSQDNVSIIGIKPFLDFEELAALTRHDAVGKTVDVNAMLKEQPDEEEFDELSDILTIDLDEIIGKHKQTPKPASFVPEDEPEEETMPEETSEEPVYEEEQANEEEQLDEPVYEEQPVGEIPYEPVAQQGSYHEPFVFRYQPKENEAFVLPEVPKHEMPVVENVKPEDAEVHEPVIEDVKPEEVKVPEAVIEDAKPEEAEVPEPVIEDVKPEEDEVPEPVIEDVKPEEAEVPEPVIEDVKPEEAEVPEPVIEDVKPEEAEVSEPVIEDVKPEETEVSELVIEDIKPEEVEVPEPVIEDVKPEEVEVPEPVIEDVKPEEVEVPETVIEDVKPEETEVSELVIEDIKPEESEVPDPAKSVADFFGKSSEDTEKKDDAPQVELDIEPTAKADEPKHDPAKSVADFFENNEHGRSPLEYTESRENYELEAHDLFMQAQASLSKLTTLFPNKKKQ